LWTRYLEGRKPLDRFGRGRASKKAKAINSKSRVTRPPAKDTAGGAFSRRGKKAEPGEEQGSTHHLGCCGVEGAFNPVRGNDNGKTPSRCEGGFGKGLVFSAETDRVTPILGRRQSHPRSVPFLTRILEGPKSVEPFSTAVSGLPHACIWRRSLRMSRGPRHITDKQGELTLRS